MFKSINIKAGAFALVALGLIASSVSPSFAGDFGQNHPRRAEVLRRDHGLRNQIQADRGQLGGHYNQIMREDRSIRRQEQRDARINGGFITNGQQSQLNREENHLHNQVNQDFR